jgi:hypothetical protein
MLSKLRCISLILIAISGVPSRRNASANCLRRTRALPEERAGGCLPGSLNTAVDLSRVDVSNKQSQRFCDLIYATMLLKASTSR